MNYLRKQIDAAEEYLRDHGELNDTLTYALLTHEYDYTEEELGWLKILLAGLDND